MGYCRKLTALRPYTLVLHTAQKQSLEVGAKLRLLQDVWSTVTIHNKPCDGRHVLGPRVRDSLDFHTGLALQSAAQPTRHEVARVHPERQPCNKSTPVTVIVGAGCCTWRCLPRALERCTRLLKLARQRLQALTRPGTADTVGEHGAALRRHHRTASRSSQKPLPCTLLALHPCCTDLPASVAECLRNRPCSLILISDGVKRAPCHHDRHKQGDHGSTTRTTISGHLSVSSLSTRARSTVARQMEHTAEATRLHRARTQCRILSLCV